MRRLFVLVAVGTLLFAGVFLAIFGPPSHATTWLWYGAFVVGGLSILVGGLRDSVTAGSTRVPWYVFVGVGQLLFALSTVVMNGYELLSGTSETLFGPLVGLACAFFIAFFGVDYVDYVRGGVYMRLPTTE
ncbi:hypothetical protein [Halogranum rubrum]|uniref:Uncharacterized protein n=1 Tax=Halogranum salarium B-1 TaxID=1210908 RepID=J2ZFC2_9EURY|nr:hypothetical protein [Halogranum salarium]EJN59390.1 hypothetical protein HSB1_28110 [Halogranum salarium B-1]